jgi:NADH-quinone oxidoreductase subunit L
MLMLVMSNNFLQLFFGWEAVGLVSYLLIGFWYKRPTAIKANLKAFLVNRVGDFGFLIGIGLIFAYFGTLDYREAFALAQNFKETIIEPVPGWQWSLITAICIGLFIGAMGKSAQFPLHVWLPDSMEGPTPISALIHAATMVTAGIFMVARMSPLFEMSETALSFVLIIGSITALFMGFLGIVQNDIKRVVAYSTLSQLGYMTVALGVSAYSVAIFHLMTHAFFKALLFLGAGSVIMGMHHNQDMRYMGGAWKYMKITWVTSLIGSLALIGTPFFSGFYSKDSIIEAVKYASIPGAGIAYFAVVAGVFVTAFYSFRMYFLVFHGKERYDDLHRDHDHDHDHADHEHHGLAKGEKPHESPWVVTVPLVLLAIPSVFIGLYTIQPMLFGKFFEGVIYVAPNHDSLAGLREHFTNWAGMAIHGFQTVPFWFAAAGVALAWFFYMKRPDIPAAIKQRFGFIYRLLDNKYYLDKLYENVIVKAIAGPIAAGAYWFNNNILDGILHLVARVSRTVSGWVYRNIDQRVVDGTVNNSGRATRGAGGILQPVQSGKVSQYGALLFSAAAVAALVLVIINS